MNPRNSTSSANGAMKHNTPTLKNVMFGFTFDVSANAISIGSVAIAAKARPRPIGAQYPARALRA